MKYGVLRRLGKMELFTESYLLRVSTLFKNSSSCPLSTNTGLGGYANFSVLKTTSVLKIKNLSVILFLKLRNYLLNFIFLIQILGPGMSEKTWEVTIKHAKTCELGNKRYILHGQNFSITLNPICQVVSAVIDGQTFSTSDLPRLSKVWIDSYLKQKLLGFFVWVSFLDFVYVVRVTFRIWWDKPMQIGAHYKKLLEFQARLLCSHKVGKLDTIGLNNNFFLY